MSLRWQCAFAALRLRTDRGAAEQPRGPQNTGEPVADESEGFTIGFANVFVGNTWRAQYVADAEAMAEQLKAEGRLKELIITDADNDVSKQITQINNMIDEGVDAIMITPVFRDFARYRH